MRATGTSLWEEGGGRLRLSRKKDAELSHVRLQLHRQVENGRMPCRSGDELHHHAFVQPLLGELVLPPVLPGRGKKAAKMGLVTCNVSLCLDCRTHTCARQSTRVLPFWFYRPVSIPPKQPKRISTPCRSHSSPEGSNWSCCESAT